MRTLTLQITRPNFEFILKGEQKVEHRNIYPKNADRYIKVSEKVDENGEPYDFVETVKYDAMYLINGRRKDAPRLLVEILAADYMEFEDENGEPVTYTEDGETYYAAQVWYCLGNVLKTENCENLEFKHFGKEHYQPTEGDLRLIEAVQKLRTPQNS